MRRHKVKYSTQELYGIDPKDLANMRYYDALQKCRQGAIAHKNRIVYSKPMCELTSGEQELLTYLEKSIVWCEKKLDEME